MKLLTTALLLFTSAFAQNTRFLIESVGSAPEGADVIVEYGNKTISVFECDLATITSISDIPTVVKVEEDVEVFLEPVDDEVNYFGGRRLEQTNLPSGLWGLDLLDDDVDGKYTYVNDGDGVVVYIIDSGVSRHNDFKQGRKSRVIGGKAFGNLKDWRDCDGHGTHVASTVAGKKHGVAKKADIVSARVFPCRGGASWSTVIEAMYWILPQKKGIVNMSLGGGKNSIINGAVKDLVNEGHVVVVAAGNSARNACNYSPASAEEALTVGCINQLNQECYFSNEGSCLDLFAPGQGILGAKHGGGTVHLSGTSMSSPHVAGIAALIKQLHPALGPKEISQKVLDLAVEGTLEVDFPDSPDLSARIPQTTLSPVIPSASPTIAPSIAPAKCFQNKKPGTCNPKEKCRWYKSVGCRGNNFCGFKSRRKCRNWKRCEWKAGKCTLKLAL